MHNDLRQQKMKWRAIELEFPLTQEKRHPPPRDKECFTQSQSELLGNVSLPLSLSFLMRDIKHRDKDILIHVLIDEDVFGMTFQLLVFKDDITQLCCMQRIGAAPMTLY